MSEYIKTALQIEDEHEDSQWVSLKWICEQIRAGHLTSYYGLLLMEEKPVENHED